MCRQQTMLICDQIDTFTHKVFLFQKREYYFIFINNIILYFYFFTKNQLYVSTIYRTLCMT